MFVKLHDGTLVVASVYPFAQPHDDPRFVGSSASFSVMPEGDILFNGKPTTVDGVARQAAQMVAAVIEAERLAGKVVDRQRLTLLAQLLEMEVMN